MESERLAETPLLVAIRELRVDIDRLIDEQKRLLAKSSAVREAEQEVVRAAMAAAPALASATIVAPARTPANSAAAAPIRNPPGNPKPSREPAPVEPAGDDIGRRLKDLNSRLERLRTTVVDSGEPSARAGG